jgi:uncharacterized protein (TIGR02099 family)
MKRVARAGEFLAWTAFFAIVALVLAVRLWFLPNIERYREDIAAFVSKSVGQPVAIGAIEARWVGLNPRIRVRDVRVLDQEGREALVLPAAEKVVAWRALLNGAIELGSLTIEGPRLHVRRDSAGELYVAGVKLAGGSGQLGGWLLAQPDIVVRDAEVQWHDEKRGAPPLLLSAVSLRMRNDVGGRSVGLTARPPEALGAALDVRAVGSRNAAPTAWSGRLYAELGATDLAAWRPWVDYPLELSRGQGALRLWLDLEQGEVTRASADVSLTGVQARFRNEKGKTELAPLALAALEGRLQARAGREGYELAGRGLALRFPWGPAARASDFRATWTVASGAGPARGAFFASRVELEPLARLAASLPFPAAARALLAEVAPRGELSQVDVAWTGDIEAPASYTASARFSGLTAAPWREVPGFAGLGGSFEASERGGRVRLSAKNGALEAPSILPQPRVALERLEGDVQWERYAERGVRFHVSSLAFTNADFSGTLSGTYSYPGSGPGIVDLSAHFDRADAAQTARYLPHGKYLGGDEVRGWIAAAVRAGHSGDVRLRIKGDLREFPFRNPRHGEFSVRARIEKGVLAYAPEWPSIEAIEGELVFERDRMEVIGRSGTTHGVALAQVRVAIPRLDDAKPQLLISGEAEGRSAEFLRFVRESPVRALTAGAPEAIAATGRGRLRLKIDLPLADPGEARVTGAYEFTGNQVALHDDLPPIERASGKLAFTESSVELQDLQGQLFGGPVSLSGGNARDGSIQLVAKGEATVHGVGTLLDHPWRRYLDGMAPYVAAVQVAQGRARIRFESSLQGVESRLPAPLAKAADEALPLRVELAPAGQGERLSITLDRVLTADVARRREGDAMRVQRAAIVLSPPAELPARLLKGDGLLLYGSLPALDLDRWRPLLEAGPGGPVALDLRIGRLDLYGKRLHEVIVRAASEGDGWKATLHAEEMEGELAYRAEAEGRLRARFEHFRVPEAYAGAPDANMHPEDLPSLDFVAQRFAYRGRDLGRVELVAERAGADWRIDQLTMTNADAKAAASGAWRGGERARASLQFELSTADAGRFLGRVGYADVVRGGRADVKGQLGWEGDLAQIDYASLTGEVELHARDGQFLEVDPGAGKLLMLMSLQHLPRRIVLDFRDVFAQGFDFERIDSAGAIEGGIMGLKEFRMRGAAAQVEMKGDVDLAREVQDLRVRVMPRLGDSASTLIALVNPLLAIPAAIMQKILKDPLGHIFAFDYAVSGGWSDPKVERIGVEAQVLDMPPGQ